MKTQKTVRILLGAIDANHAPSALLAAYLRWNITETTQQAKLIARKAEEEQIFKTEIG